MSRIQTGRDPFARLTIRKRKAAARSCSWCGSSERRLWQYCVDADSPRESGDIAGAFCNVDCLNSYCL